MFAPLLCLAVAVRLAAQNPTAAQLFAQGEKAEKAGHMAQAYLLYSKAAAKDPQNETYWARSQAVRPEASQEVAPKTLPTPDKPEGELPSPLHFDSITAQDLLDARKPLPPTELSALPGVKDFNLRAPERSVFETVAQAFGLDCDFDADYPPGNLIHFEITGADYRTALHALEAATGSFLVPLTTKRFLVAKDTPQKRAALEPVVAVEVHLSDPTNPQDFTGAVTAVQQSMALEKVSWDTQTKTVVLRDRISKVLPARAMLEQLMRPRAQVMIETDVIEVDRNDMLQWGLSLPNVFNITPYSAALTAVDTLAELGQWGPMGTLFAISISNASLVAQFTNSKTSSIYHADLRAVDGQPASIHSGERYPVLTSAYTGSNEATSTTTPTTTTTSSTGTTSLTNANTFGSATNPSAVVVADFNGDGIPDFASANSGSNSVSVYLGIGNGTFENPVTYAVGKNPSAIIAVSLRNNGYFDLVTADTNSNDVGVLLGNGNGTFNAYTPFTVGTQPAALVTTDFNGDGIADIAVANSGSNNVSILLGKGDGTFESPSTLSVGTSPRSLATADFNNDGYADLAVADYTSNDLWIFLGNSNGTFTNKATYTGLSAPLGITAQYLDLNESTYVDLVVANSSASTVSVFLGAGNGTFPTVNTYSTGTSSEPVSVITADFTNDNIYDIATADYGTGTVSLFIGNGDGTFQTAIQVSIGTGLEPISLAAGIFNDDGYEGLMVANFAGNDFAVLLGEGNGSFSNASGTTYSYSGGSSYAPPPAFNYEDLGFALKVTPHVHGINDVGLDLEAEVELLDGNYVNGNPEIAQRKLQSQVNLRAGECAVVAGLLSDEDARTILGIPGLSTLPGLGQVLRSNTKNITDSQVLLIIRPVLISLPPDQIPSRAFWVGSEARPLTPL